MDVVEDIPIGDLQRPNGYDDLLRRAVSRRLAGVVIHVADLGDIIVSKEAADRPKDREALPELKAPRAVELAATGSVDGPDLSNPTPAPGGASPPREPDPPGRSLG